MPGICDAGSIFGLIDHGSRALLRLAALPNKCSWTLLGHLFLAIGPYGKPRAVRTDNEACFTSRLFRTALFALGIRHERSDPGCPWQNGRIERLFGTLKDKLDRLEVACFDALNTALGDSASGTTTCGRISISAEPRRRKRGRA